VGDRLLPRFGATNASPFRRRERAAALVLALGLGVAGCILPADAYSAFIERAPAPDAAPTSAGDGGESCSDILAGDPSGTFYGACLTSASSDDITQATYVKLVATVVTAPGGQTAGITSQMTSLVRSPSNISDTTGATSSPPTAPVAADCTYVIDAGTTTIPPLANFTGFSLVLENTVYRGKLLTPDSSCADLDATISSPTTVDLETGGNYCVFRRAPPSGAVTLFTLSDYACPGAPGAPPM
jgi:hypothetical protein